MNSYETFADQSTHIHCSSSNHCTTWLWHHQKRWPICTWVTSLQT